MRRDELPSKERTTREILELIKQRADQGRDLWETYEDYFSAVRELDDHKENRELLERLSKTLSKEFDKDIFETWRHSLLFEAPYSFDAFCLYVELDCERKFYAPRREKLKPIVNALQRLADDEIDILAISTPPRIGKTTLAIRFIQWLAGRNPQYSILSSSHSESFLKGLYQDCMSVFDPDGEYLWHDVFPNCSVKMHDASELKIDINKSTRFPTLQFASVGSNLAGKVNAQQLLYCDDLVESGEEALSPSRLEKKFRLYTNDLEQRKEGGCKELHISTRWALLDPVGRIQEREEGNPRAEFIVIPALDENGESNFDFDPNVHGAEKVGFTTEHYEKMKKDYIHADQEYMWDALFMGQPIERKGILFPKNNLRKFFELPCEPDAVVAVCDTATGSGDSFSMPIIAIIGEDHYVIDWIFTSNEFNITRTWIVNALIDNKVSRCRFESNNAGGAYASDIEKMLKERKNNCYIETKWTQSNKITKIQANAPFIKNRMLFLDDSKIIEGSMYERAMDELTHYTIKGKNVHDDAADSLAQYAEYSSETFVATATLLKRFF